MKKNSPCPDKKTIPAPFRSQTFRLLKKGISDDARISVYVNSEGDFAFLDPQPLVDYKDYRPRVLKLNLASYKKMDKLSQMRYEKLAPFFSGRIREVLEIGAAEGSFLRILRNRFPRLGLSCVEPDKNTLPARKKIVSLRSYPAIQDLLEEGKKFDLIFLFHVLEHITDPESFLKQLGLLMSQGSRLVIEVPSLFDPLLSLYHCRAYQEFYFQKQHPFVYSRLSLPRLMEYFGFRTKKVISFQRYGLENHLNWLVNGICGGNESFRKIFSPAGPSYIAGLERSGHTDSVIWIGTVKGE